METYFQKIIAGGKMSHFTASAYGLVMLLGKDLSLLLKY